ncbi:fibronectin type III domain-containing protein [Paenibacillus sp. MSJ-34]|uniref:fibronectin type III domain-containing protein n=1 Tax=Paenibacillus sp. MSJ-34 TaxID=2841529 RepID=UPI001C0FB841|nr:fibronectin type III domain-containing protein [Paenibacillus sp. MSJ-34]MBU5444787.1 fibronectin type III domain-containing protein [Paenibacillus sp. MSJ-34]
MKRSRLMEKSRRSRSVEVLQKIFVFVLLISAFFSAQQSSFADTSLNPIEAGTNPQAVAVNPVTNKIYVVNFRSHNVTVIDGANGTTKTVGVGTFPSDIAVNPVTNKIYVTNSYSNNVTVIDGTNDTTKVVDVRSSSRAIAVNPVTNKIYVVNSSSNAVTVIDGANDTTDWFTGFSGPQSIAVNPVTNKIYVANLNSHNVMVIDGANDTRKTVGVGTSPQAIAVNPVTDKIYVANSGSNDVTVIDGASNTTTTVEAGILPRAIAVNPVTNKIYVANNGSNNVTVIDGTSNTPTTVEAGTAPSAVVVNPVTNKIYVANLNSNNVTVIDGASNTTTTVEVGSYPLAIAVNPVTNKIYVANNGSHNVTVIDGAGRTAPPVASPPGGEVEPGTLVTLTTTTDGAVIYYTLDGSTPSNSSTKYTEPIKVTAAMTIKAIAIKDGMIDSEAIMEQYTVQLPAPSAPENVTGVAGDKQVTLNWSTVANAQSYNVYKYEGASAPANANDWILIQQDVTATTYTVTDLANGTNYAFAVKALNPNGASDFSNAVIATPVGSSTPTVPGQPVNVLAEAGDSQAKVSFEAPGDDGGSNILQYTVTAWVNGIATPDTKSGDSSPIIMTGLTNGMTYTFTVVATNGVGDSIPSAQSNPVTPTDQQPGSDTEAPKWPIGSGVTVSDIKQTSVKLSWPSATDNVGVTGYRIYVNGTEHETVGGVNGTTVTSLAADTTYMFKVIAYDAAGNESAALTTSAKTLPEPSEPDTEAPQWPDDSELTVSDVTQTSVKLSWPSATDNVGVTGYRIYVDEVEYKMAGGSENTITVNGLMAETNYMFKVTAHDEAGNVSAGLTASAKTLPRSSDPDTEAPQWPDDSELTVSDVTQTSVKLTWPSATDNVGVTGYRIYVNGTEHGTVGGNVNRTMINGLTANTSYMFKVTAYDAAENKSEALTVSAKTLPQPTEPDTEAPQWPDDSELTVSDVTQTSVKLSWPSATDNVGVAGYRIYVDDIGHKTAGSSENTIIVTGLTAGMSYAFKVKVYDEAGNESAGLTASAKTLPRPSDPDNEAPQWPDDSKLTVSDVIQTSVKLTWPSATDNIGVTGYRIYIDNKEHTTVSGNVYVATVDRLTANTTYVFKVTAYDAVGNESASLSKQATTARSSGGGGGSGGSGGGGGSYELSNNADLADLQIRAKDKKLRLSPLFASGTTEYTARTEAVQIEIVVKEVHSAAKVILNDKVISGRIKVDLKEGDNTFVLTVQAENGTKKKYTLTIYRETPKPYEPVIEFTDIAGHWAENHIKHAAAKGIVRGYPDGTFQPNHPITRAEFAVMLTGALRLEEKGVALTFNDNDQIVAWAKQAVAQAVQAGIIDGYEDGSFRPNASVTRAEMAVMLARAIKLPLGASTTTGFVDDHAIPQWAKGSVEAIHGLSIVNGRVENKFAPNDTMTRAEAATILLRMVDILK